MTHEIIFEKIVSVLTEEFEVEASDITMEANLFTDLELDSLDAIDLMVTLDKELDVEIKTEDMKDVRTVSDICDFILATASDE